MHAESILTDRQFYAFDDCHAVCPVGSRRTLITMGTATINTPVQTAATVTIDNKLQQSAVRLLLQRLIEHRGGGKNSSNPLNERRHPYRLAATGEFVSFTHSQRHVACALSHHPIGIDVETKMVKLSVIQRWFHHQEYQYLSKLSTQAYEQYVEQSRLLWMIKEARLKVLFCLSHKRHSVLASELKKNDLPTLHGLLDKASPYAMPWRQPSMTYVYVHGSVLASFTDPTEPIANCT